MREITVQEVRFDTSVNNTQEGVKVLPSWYFDLKPYWALISFIHETDDAVVDFIRAADQKVAGTVQLNTGLPIKLDANCSDKKSRAHMDFLYQTHLVNLPDAGSHRNVGIGIERAANHEELLFGVIDRTAFYFRAFPKVDRYDDKKVLSYFDAGYAIESCAFNRQLCFGIVPFSINLYTTYNQIQTYFSPAISLSFMPPLLDSINFNVAFESKSFFDKNIRNTVDDEITTWTLGFGFSK